MPVNCRLVEHTVTPDAAVARRLLTMIERQPTIARRDLTPVQTFYALSTSLL
ncbi:MAG: hypothetical protein GDA41_03470 [Rhodospirillales bacterium]|nr:hypothetical protein [Rhodospirillales bacterium]